MKTLRETKVKICMLILVLLIQVASPLLTIMVENSFALITLGAETTWDISTNGDGSVTAVLDEEGTLTITGTGAMKHWSSNGDVPWFSITTKIKKVVIGEGVTSIGTWAFAYCSSLKEITIPEGVTSIGKYAFAYCTSLTEITIPSSVTSVGSYAFWLCRSLTICCKTDSTAHKHAIDNNISVKLDDDAPSITKVEGNPTEWTKEDVVLTVTAEDEGAGLAEKAYSFDNGQTWQKENTKTYTENTSNIVIKVRDALGNIATYETINISKIFKVSIKGYEEVEIENNKYIKNIKINETIGNLKENITTSEVIKIYKGEKEITDNNTKLATGMKLTILVESEVADEYIVVVTGDVNGDGEANLNDILSINKHRLNKMLLSGANLLAGDVDGNGKADLNDILKINKFRLGKIESL